MNEVVSTHTDNSLSELPARSELPVQEHIHYKTPTDDKSETPAWDADMAVAAFNRQEENK